MAKKSVDSRPKRSKRVVVSSSNVKEKISRNSLELQISPWNCIPISGANDHGYDYTVEIVSKADLDNYVPDGRFFMVQLKSQAKLTKRDSFIVPHPIETKKIQQWYKSSTQIPFLYVVNDLSDGCFYYQWIDELFVSALERENPFWSSKDKVTIKLPSQNTLAKGENPTIRDYVYNHRYTAPTVLEPGVFFDLKEKISAAIFKYDHLINNSPFDSVKKDVERLNNELENAAYRIAITGLSRVGKSSLINKLLKREDISPTNVWQTTGVPIIILPGKAERIKINFQSKPSETYHYDSDVIKQYATREFNEENHKKVKDVCVFISSSQLERGVMFYDIPGLDDPNDEIMEFAHHTAECANVVLYLIDGSSARSGGFVFKNDYKKDIENFASTSKEKIFLVVTKVDEVPLERLKELKKEIDKNLVKYNLKSKVASKVYYLPVSPSPANNGNLVDIHSEINSLQELDGDLWAFMLKENKVGLVKLYTLLKELHDSQKQLAQIIRSRVLDAKDKKRLIDAINLVKQKIPSLEKYIHNENEAVASTVTKNLQLRKENIIQNLKTELLKLDDMPSESSIKNYLAKNGYHAVNKTQEDMGLRLTRLRDYMDNWVKDNLNPVQDIINIQKKGIEDPLKNIEDINFPPMDFSSMWGKGILLTLAGIVVTSLPGVGFIIGAGSMFLDFLFGKEDRHAKRVRKTIDKVDELYSKAFADAEFQFKTILDEQIIELIEYANRKLKLYFSDIETQINSFNLTPNFDYMSFEKRAEDEIPKIQSEVDGIWSNLQGHLAATKLLN